MLNSLKLSRILTESDTENVVEILRGYYEEILGREGDAVKRSSAAADGDESSRYV